MNKKIISAVITAIAACLISVIITVPSHAETVSGKEGDNLTWEFDTETGVLTISGTGDMEDKSTYKYGWYDYKDDITTVIIEDGVTSIGKSAFYYYTNLTYVDMGDTVTSIGYGAFRYSGLEEIEISESLVSIGESAFSNCTALTEVELPDSLASIDVYAFYYCVALESIDLGDGLETLGAYAFECCESLKAITIPGGVTTIEEYTFWNCEALESVEICEGVSVIENHAFFNAGVTELKFPDSLTKIETAAFRNAYNLETVEFGTGLEYIGNGAFWLCYELSTIIFHGDAPELGTEAVDGFYGLTPFYGVTADVYYYEDTDGWTEEVLESMTKHVYTTFTYHCLSADEEESAADLSDEDVEEATTISDHNWSSVTVSAGSNGSTVTTYTCSVCGAEKTVTSLYGSSRYETAADIISNTFESSTYAVIAAGSNFPDALAAASLAGALDAPILITSDSRIQDTIEELESLGVTYVYIVGGTSSVSVGVQSAIEAEGISVSRIAGDTRQLTAAAVAEKVLSITGTQDVCLVATGSTYADALAASPYAYWSASPIYLTKNDGSISDEVLASIEAAGYSRIIILGGTSSVTEETEAALSEIASVTRLGGDTRYETAAIIAEWSVEQGMSYDGLTVATGTNYPDALTASALCGKNGSVLLLSGATVEASTVLEEVIDANVDNISDIYIVGGYSSVSEEIREIITDALIK